MTNYIIQIQAVKRHFAWSKEEKKKNLFRWPAVTDFKQSKSKMTPFNIVIPCNLHYDLITGVFKVYIFIHTHQWDLIHIQRTQSMHTESNIFTFQEWIKWMNLRSNRAWCLVNDWFIWMKPTDSRICLFLVALRIGPQTVRGRRQMQWNIENIHIGF